MAAHVLNALDEKIAELESTIAALRSARTALGGGASPAAKSQPKGKPGRRSFTKAQRAEISRRMKALWAKRRSK